MPRRREAEQVGSPPLPSDGEILHQVPQGQGGARRGHGRHRLFELPYGQDHGPETGQDEVPLLPRSGRKTRKRLRAEGSLDVTHFAPNAAIIKKAVKIVVNENSHMQFFCYECHKPHTAGKMKPKTEDCLMKCHSSELMSGKHTVHLTMGMNCKDCHKPHTWVVTEASAKKDCVACHEFRSPKSFL